MEKYDHQVVEKKWRAKWEQSHIDETDIALSGKGKDRKPFYNLMMFPYPSAEGLHVGNMYAFTGSDILGRFKRMQGYEVFEPIGLDGFGIHSENYALKVGRHPMDHAAITQKNFYTQLHRIGAMFDWLRTVETYHTDYYRYTQWLFVQMFKHGLAYRGKAQVNWCPGCKTVLADEQVVKKGSDLNKKGLTLEEVCERCGSTVEKRSLEQWFFRITAYAEKLLGDIPKLNWSQKVLTAQKNWIGKKIGIDITYKVQDSDLEVVCFTTTPVNFAATFLVLAPEHSLALRLAKVDQLRYVKEYIDTVKKLNTVDRITQGREKTGVFTGSYAINHLTGEPIPIWVSDFVLMGVGTGAIQACPGHDLRDFEFAQKFSLPIKRVVVGDDGDTGPINKPEQVIEHGGTMVNSEFLDGLPFEEAMEKTKDYFEKKDWGKRVTTYHLRDWLISRQRYWGPPIPMIKCPTCGWQPVPEKDLPVLLPRIEDYKPGNDGVAPLAKHKEFYETTCPKCGGKAVRETDVSDTFLDSSWYFLRYPSVSRTALVGNENFDQAGQNFIPSPQEGLPWDPAITKKWLPVSMYTGGAEHSVLHLMYSRFVTMALHDWGYLEFEEPFPNFFAHGLIIKDGVKMSKSKGNVVNPDEYIDRYGADALRLYLMFTGPFSQGGDFRDSAMEGTYRWINRVWRFAQAVLTAQTNSRLSLEELEETKGLAFFDKVEKALHKLVKKVGEDIEARRYNTAIAAMMEFTNLVQDNGGALTIDQLKTFLLILAPFAPFLTEELWQQLKPSVVSHQSSDQLRSIHLESWPSYDPSKTVEDKVEIVIQVNGKVRDKIVVDRQTASDKEKLVALAKKCEKVLKHVEGKTIAKTIVVPGRLVNMVI